jgi:hypothetical protein
MAMEKAVLWAIVCAGSTFLFVHHLLRMHNSGDYFGLALDGALTVLTALLVLKELSKWWSSRNVEDPRDGMPQ